MQLKSNHVNLAGMSVQILLALIVADEVYKQFGREVTVTSVNDSTHGVTSLHYAGQAADLRIQNPINGTKYFEDELEVVRRIKSRLNQDFDVMLETDHIHIEYQPRKK
jgi:hypothetical protein